MTFHKKYGNWFFPAGFVLAGFMFWLLFAGLDCRQPMGQILLTDSPGQNSDLALQIQPPQESKPSQQELEIQRKMEKEKKKKDYENTKKMADELAKAAEDLRDSINKAGENTLPLDAIRKAEEIESLAKKIKAKLKGNG